MITARKRIPSVGPSITPADVEAVTDAARTGWYEGMRHHTDAFVEAMLAHTGMTYCLPVSHCTAAIHLAMLALGVGKGDEVIVPDLTWVASACPVDYVGARVVLADVDRHSWCLSPESFERNITKRTKAVVAVGLYGNMPAMAEINAIARRHRITVIEDAAESIGATYDGRPAGTLGKIGVYSFNGTKLTVAGQGGAAVTNDRRLYDRMALLSHHGIDKRPGARYYWSTAIGYNYNWSNLQAALALSQVRRLEELVAIRRRIFGWYRERLGRLEYLQLNSEAANVRNTYWLVNAIVDHRLKWRKERIQAALAEHAIDARPFFYPISAMPPYRRHVGSADMRKRNPISYALSPYGINLPCAFTISEDEVDYVCQTLRTLLER